MDPALLSAGSALAGSLIGASASFATSWLTHSGGLRAQRAQMSATKRETLYAEFINEVSKRLAEAAGKDAETAEVLVPLFAAVGRMRLVSSRPVVDAAAALVRLVAQTYAAPNLTFRELQALFDAGGADPLEAFGEACRTELMGTRD